MRGCSTLPEEEMRQLKTQIEQLNMKLSSKTETILRLGKDLEEAEKGKRLILASKMTFERNLERAEREIERLVESDLSMKTSFMRDKETLLKEIERLKKESFSLKLENRELQAEKLDLQKDCKIFRQQMAKYEVEKIEMESVGTLAGSISTRMFGNRMSEENLGMNEKLYAQYKQMESDLHTVLGVKEELVKERENLLQKVERLSSEMSFLLNGDSRRVAEDLDGLVAENRYLKAQLSTANEESASIKSTLAKYRSMTEARHSNPPNTSSNQENSLEDKSNVAVVNMKQIRELLTSQSIELDDSDLRAITTILLDVCNDKQMVLTHLRRANKVLGTRLHEVEGHLAVLESKSRSCSPREDKKEENNTQGADPLT